MTENKRGYRILIIEDNPGDFVLVEDFLIEQFESPVITHRENFSDTKDILEGGVKFDAILLDLSLPDKQGEDLIREIVELAANIPVIVLTGYTNFSFGVRSLSLGVSDYILKDELTGISLHKSILYSAERKRAITALAESEKRYSALFHLSPMPMWVVDAASQQFLDVNMATINHYGYTREELLKMTIRDIRQVAHQANTGQVNATGSAEPAMLPESIMIHKKKNGELRQVEIQVAPFRYKGVNANIVIATDITDRLNYIKAIEEQNEKLREIAWMQSHVVRAPVARIMGLIQMITDFDQDMAEKEQVLGFIMLSAEELDVIIRDISAKTDTVSY